MPEEIENKAPQAPTAAPAHEAAGEHKPAAKKNPMGLWIGIVVVVIVVIAGGWWFMQKNTAAPVQKDRTVKVGIFEELVGDSATLSMSFKEGAGLGQKQLNAPGLHVELIPSNNICEPDKAVQAVKDLAKQGVVAIIGDGCSGAMLEAAPIANQLHVVMMSPSATNPKVTDAGDYIFRVIPSDAYSGKFTADLLYKKGIRRLAIFNGAEAYGQGLEEEVSKDFIADGGQVVASESIANEDPNVLTQMNKIRTAKPDALYIAFNGTTTIPVAVLQYLKTNGMSIPIYSSETLKDPIFIHDAGTLAEGVITIAVSDGTPSFTEQMEAAYGKAPDIYSAQAYDAYQALFEALKSGATTGPEIKDALYKVNFQGASGHIVFDKNGDVPPNYTVYRVVNGKFVVQSN